METFSSIRRTASGRALSPTRERILRLLEETPTPQSIPNLARKTSLHENTIRGHVLALWDDGYLKRTRQTGDNEPGRPAWLWHATPRTPSSPYVALASALAKHLAATHPEPGAEARKAGRVWGTSLAANHPTEHDGDELVLTMMREEGFAPELHADRTILLKQCPLIEAATEHPDIVCAVHLGMIEAALESRKTDSTGTTLTPFTAPGTCTLHLAAPQAARKSLT